MEGQNISLYMDLNLNLNLNLKRFTRYHKGHCQYGELSVKLLRENARYRQVKNKRVNRRSIRLGSLKSNMSRYELAIIHTRLHIQRL